MTDHEVNEARVKEAIRLWQAGDYPGSFSKRADEPDCATVARIAMQLDRQGWLPNIDPLLIEAREILAEQWGNSDMLLGVRAGKFDKNLTVMCALAGLCRGIQIGKGKP